MLFRTTRLLVTGLVAFGFALSAQAGPAMFQASFIMHAFGNDTTTGTVNPYNTYDFTGMPLGHNCMSPSPYTSPSSAPAPYYCTQATMQAGLPATGAGTLLTGSATVGGPVGLPANAFNHGQWSETGMTPISAGITGFLPIYYPYLQSHTYATFQNAAASFFAGGGPVATRTDQTAMGNIVRTGKAKRVGTWIIQPGANTLGGPMAILGRLGAHGKYKVPGQAGTYDGTTSWNMVKALGRVRRATPMATQPDPMNPYTNTGQFINTVAGKTSTLSALATGTPWTTGDVTLYAKAGYFTTILRRGGFDTTTGTGTAKVRNIQLVTPALTHWQGPGVNTHTGHIGILTLQLQAAPEPSAMLLLAAGGGVLALLYRVSRRG